jgi:hypothetical protein
MEKFLKGLWDVIVGVEEEPPRRSPPRRSPPKLKSIRYTRKKTNYGSMRNRNAARKPANKSPPNTVLEFMRKTKRYKAKAPET